MTPSLISLLSIVFGIIGANAAGVIFKKHTFGFTGNTIVGVFGSILFIKSFGRMGFDPKSIMESGGLDYSVLSLNLFVAFIGGAVALFIGYKLRKLMQKE